MNEVKEKRYKRCSLVQGEKFGQIGGNDIFLFTLSNYRGSALKVTNYGAAAVSLHVPNKIGEFVDVLLGYDCLDKYVSDPVYMGAVVGRCANRIAGSKVIIDGNEYALHIREGGYHAHGGKEGFNKKIFDFSFFEIGAKLGIAFHYKSKHLEEGYPGNLDFTVRYFLDDENNWIVEYFAETDRATIINPTHHAYFNLSGKPGTSILNHHLQINSHWYLPVNKMVVPTGEFALVYNTPFDFLQSTLIGFRIDDNNEQLGLGNGYDHGWALKKSQTPDLIHAATVWENESGIQLDLYTTEPDLHFYAGNWLNDSIIGKSGAVYDSRTGFCFETQHFPDTPNKPHFPSIVITPQEKFYSKTIFQFTVNEF